MLKKINLVKWMLIHLLFLVFITSCNNSDRTGNPEEVTTSKASYTIPEIAWTMQIPEGWKIIPEERLLEYDKKGLAAMEKTVGEKIDYSGLKHLINFSKNQFNIFQSTIEPFKVEYDGEWEENEKALREVILSTYKAQGIQAEVTEISNENIDGINFHKFEITIYSPKGEFILTQIMFSYLINGFDFGATIISNNEEDKRVMLEAFRHSHFGKKLFEDKNHVRGG